MRTIVIVSKAVDWPIDIPGVDIVTARDYLVNASWAAERNVRVFNLCRSYRYQSEGYYVSLLAAARKHRPFPALMTVLDMRSPAVVRIIDDELDQTIQKSLCDIRSKEFELSMYFGRNMAQRHLRLASKLFAQFPAPLVRASFSMNGRWKLTSVALIGFKDVPASHWEFVRSAANTYFGRPRYQSAPRRSARYDLAILHDPKESLAPSGPKTLQRFRVSAEKLGFGVELIQREDYARLAEFDALFIRETTYVNHHTFRFAQRAQSLGLVVIDDPDSILRCTNKVYQTEAFERAKVPVPLSLIANSENVLSLAKQVGFPCILKVPDSAFSRGVVKCSDQAELERESAKILEKSDLLLIQEFMPSDFDWRVGILAGSVLFVCKYHMARGHWQIVKKTDSGSYRFGRVDPVHVKDVPAQVLDVAIRAAATIGDGLYGVDLKQSGARVVVTEVNDNPNIDVGCEDALLTDDMYLIIMKEFLKRIQARKDGSVL